MKNIDRHFSKIAHDYRYLRRTDIEPILYITKILRNIPMIEAADVGCGTGRYDLKLFHHLSGRLLLHCIDQNENMLDELKKYLTRHDIINFHLNKGSASNLPLDDESLDSLFTFNAIHHFNLKEFFQEASRVLKKGGYLFVYTRLKSQNARNIWGKHFPLFNEKETRLYEKSSFTELLDDMQSLKIESIKFFKFKRASRLDLLIDQVMNFHYSTFYLYSKDEFIQSLNIFKQNINKTFKNIEKIQWTDENTLLVIRKEQ